MIRKSSFLCLLLVVASMSITMTSCGDDEKPPEVVVDPLTEMEYYISGKAYEGVTPETPAKVEEQKKEVRYTGMNETSTNVDASQHSGGIGGKLLR